MYHLSGSPCDMLIFKQIKISKRQIGRSVSIVLYEGLLSRHLNVSAISVQHLLSKHNMLCMSNSNDDRDPELYINYPAKPDRWCTCSKSLPSLNHNSRRCNSILD